MASSGAAGGDALQPALARARCVDWGLRGRRVFPAGDSRPSPRPNAGSRAIAALNAQSPDRNRRRETAGCVIRLLVAV